MLRTAQLAFFGFALAAYGEASACSSRDPEPTQAELFERAEAVFVARITSTKAVIASFGRNQESVPIVEGEFELVEALKGKPPTDRTVRDLVYGIGNCSLGLLSGVTYVFFIQKNQQAFVLFPGGSRPIENAESAETKELLASLRKLGRGK